MSNPEAQPVQRPNFPAMEEEMAIFWKKHRIFERSVEERPEEKTFSFYDGPPFATGTPHYGHLLQSALKDAVPRYKTMRGFRVPRVWGWDCHGLPVENLIEKSLKLNSKKDIEQYGIGKFNDACATSVMQYASEWKKYVERIGRWVEFDDAYKTMDPSYTESVWWVFSELWKKNLIYKDLRVSLYCPRCSTPLSNFEIAMGSSYIDKDDPAVTIKFPVVGQEKTFILAWTTTPWTLPANVALAVHPDEIYVKVKEASTGETYYFAEKLINNVFSQYFPLTDGEMPFEILEKMEGSQLIGLSYEPLYPLSEEAWKQAVARDGAMKFQVMAMDYVTMEDGTGIVHTAPGFGEEDFHASRVHGIPVLMTVDEEGKQKSFVTIGAGLPIKESDALVCEDLEKRGLMYRRGTVNHSVPVCWRCNTLLLQKAQPAWYVNVTTLKPAMLKTAEQMMWQPDHVKNGRFGKGLESAPDWCISRTRYWGAPLPVWTCDSCPEQKVIGSFAELPSVPKDLHRPMIDEVTLPCSCGGVMHRIADVFDCWFESGSMPYASVHYPFQHKDHFDANFPADFIAEGLDQTRGWFYSLHVLATGLFGKPAFKNVAVTGLIMAEDGKKMSKSLKNYPDPWELMTELGADTLRMYLLSSPVVVGEQLNFSRKDCEVLHRNIFGTLWNIRQFYLLFSEGLSVEFTKPKSMHVLDRWLFARLHSFIREMTEAMDVYDLPNATRPIRSWIDDLSTWWLRRSRERMKGDNEFEKMDALKTLKEALLETSRVLAPFAPFFADKLYQDIGGPKMSVHLDLWPSVDARAIDDQLLADMKWVREVCAGGHEQRALTKMAVRQALASVTVRMRDASEAERLSTKADLLRMVADELNVEHVALTSGATVESRPFDVELDIVLTPELKQKGMIREVLRRAMNLRKALGLSPADRIVLEIACVDQGLRSLLEPASKEFAKDVKADQVIIGEKLLEESEQVEKMNVDGIELAIFVRKA